MILHLFYKEWLKTKWFVLVSLLLGIGVILYMFIDLNSNIINQEGASSYMYYWLIRGGKDYYSVFKYVPIAVALLIGIAQYMPEVLQKRIKLTLHLPTNETLTLYTMVLYGFLVMLALMIIFLTVFFSFNLYFMTKEVHVMALESLTPWVMGGMVTYFFVAMIAMEPRWKFRFIYAIVVYKVVDLYLQHMNFQGIYPLLLIIFIIASVSMIYTANRFKIGEK